MEAIKDISIIVICSVLFCLTTRLIKYFETRKIIGWIETGCNLPNSEITPEGKKALLEVTKDILMKNFWTRP